jgi:copper transport protein
MSHLKPILWVRATNRRSTLYGSIIAVLALLSLPALLYAHAHLRRSEPSANERLSVAPTALRLWFTEQPELAFTRITLRGADSTVVPLGAITAISGDKFGVTAPISTTLGPGTYRILWRTAAADGHATTGTFTFSIAGTAPVTANTAPAVAATVDTAPPSGGHVLVGVDTTVITTARLSATAATRWVEFVAMLAVIGAVVFRLVVLRGFQRLVPASGTPEVRADLIDSARRLGQSALVLLLIAALSRLYEEGNALLGPPERTGRPSWRTLIFETSWGHGWLVGVIGIVVAAVGFVVAKRSRSAAGWAIVALGAIAIVVAPALTGHAMATSPVALSVILDILHVAAACAWLGALLTLLLSAVPFVRGVGARSSLGSGQLVAALVRSFHPIALTCAGIVILTGVIAAWLRLPTLSDLWTSSYGRVLIVKLCLVALVVLFGAMNWRRILPALGDDATALRLTRTASAELAIAALVLAATAALVSISPP